MKQWVLENYFDLCRDSAIPDGYTHLEIMGCVQYDLETTFERPIEQLMCEVVQLILMGGWYPEIQANMEKYIKNLLDENGLDKLLAELPPEELEEFQQDLKALKII